jgi:acetyl-CoA acetyltransferase/uncharacterized OB-fold protein
MPRGRFVVMDTGTGRLGAAAPPGPAPEPRPTRPPLPLVTPWNRFVWTSGERGVLEIARCATCGTYVHPAGPTCPECRGSQVFPEAVSGRAVVVGFTVNSQPWHPAFTPPYVIAIVALEEDAAVRLTTNIVDCSPADVRLGMAVEVRFEHHHDPQGGAQGADVWLPVFAPRAGVPDAPVTAEPVPSRDLERPVRAFAAVSSDTKFERSVVISGIGMSDTGRRLLRDPLSLMVDAVLAAIADAGLRPDDIDGLATYPGGMGFGGSSGGNIFSLEEALRLRPAWFSSGMETAGQTGQVVNAMLAVHAGLARHVVCVRGVWEGSHQHLTRTGVLPTEGGGRVSGEMEWRLPYGAFSAANWIAMMANRHMAVYGTTKEQLGAIAVNARRNAARNPSAVYREPLTLDDYLKARPITTPFGLYDCDVPCDGAVAVVVSHIDSAADLKAPLVRVEAVGTGLDERISWDQGTLLHEPVLAGAARHVWSRTDLRHGDIDAIELYDGFTFNCLSWLEQLGFCKIGEGGPFVEGGSRIALDGELPLNTHGGQLSAGRLHGWGFLHEACVQVRGEGGERQVAGAETVLFSAGGGHPGGVMILTRW